MRTVLKYAIPYGEKSFALNLPRGAKILTAVRGIGEREKQICIIALVDTDALNEERAFISVFAAPEERLADEVGPTGGRLEYVGTYEYRGGTGNVCHACIFEVAAI